MKTFMNTIIIMATVFLTSCFADDNGNTPIPAIEEVHTIVALDLSDRIHNVLTIENDIAVIKELFVQFQKSCQEALYVDSRSSFSIALIPQRGDEQLRPLIDSLSIDLGQIDDLKKRKAVESFAAKLSGRLKTLYNQAKKPSIKDYDGACIFRFLNNSLPARLDIHRQGKTRLFILSDGLIEVDSPQARVEMNGRRNFITEAQMIELRKQNVWQTADLRLLVIPEHMAKRENSQLAVCLVGLQGRADYVLEQDLLISIWETWMQEMGISSFSYISYDSEHSFILKQVRQYSQ